jgi:hypothetical protein
VHVNTFIALDAYVIPPNDTGTELAILHVEPELVDTYRPKYPPYKDIPSDEHATHSHCPLSEFVTVHVAPESADIYTNPEFCPPTAATILVPSDEHAIERHSANIELDCVQVAPELVDL